MIPVFRASMVGDLMGLAKSINPEFITDEVKAIQKKKVDQRTDDEKKFLSDLLWNTLPDGAITILDKMVSQKLLNWQDAQLDFFTLQKGIQCEAESIELYNEVKDTFYIKNVERITAENLTGECDLLDTSESLVIDIKTAYSKATFPLNLKLSKLYEWQLRSYMHLYNVNHAELAYCLVDTPEDLRKKTDPQHWHEVLDVDKEYRVSTLRIERDEVKEQQLLKRLALCGQYITNQLEVLQNG